MWYCWWQSSPVWTVNTQRVMWCDVMWHEQWLKCTRMQKCLNKVMSVCRREYSEQPKRRAKCTSTVPQTMDAAHRSVKVLTRSRARGDTLTLPNGGHRAHLLHTGTPWTYLAFNRSKKKKKIHYPVQDHEFIGTWHWQRPLTTMVTIHTTSFNIAELHTLPLVCLRRISVTTRSDRNFRTLFMAARGFEGLLQNVSEQVGDLGIYVQE